MLTTHVILWLVLVVGFLIIEAGTVALVSLWFSAGAAAALLLCVLRVPFWVQVTAFLVVSAVLLAMFRPMLRKHQKLTKTNVDSVIGSVGLVTADIDNTRSTGQVKLGPMTWTARSTAGTTIPEGTKVRVDRIEGVKVFVSPVEIPESV